MALVRRARAERARVQKLPPYTWTEEDRVALLETAKALGVEVIDLLAILGVESAFTYNPAVVPYYDKNGKPAAVGLNQITEVNAKAMGLTEDERVALLDLTAAEQLPYVVRSLVAANRGVPFTAPTDPVTLYQLNLAPATVYQDGRPPKEVIYVQEVDPCPELGKGGGNYCQNRGLDVDKDGQITRSDLRAVLEGAKDRKAFKDMLRLLGEDLPSRSTSSAMSGLVLATAGGVAVWAMTRK